MIGDNPLTDGAGARALGMTFWQACRWIERALRELIPA